MDRGRTPPNESFDEWMARLDADHERKESRVRALVRQNKPAYSFADRGGGGGSEIVSRDTENRNRWRITHLDKNHEPAGHTYANTLEAAIRTAGDYGGDIEA
jgi:hypothetical protein